MDESKGSFSSSPPLDYSANLDSLHVSVPCKSASDALLASLSVELRQDLTSNVLDAFLEVLRDPSFDAREVTFQTAHDISRHISEQRKCIAQKRSSAGSRLPVRSGSSSNLSLMKNVYGGVPPLIIDLVAQQIASEMIPFAEDVDWDTNMCNVVDSKCPREVDLLNMALVHRTWTGPVSRVLRTRAKLYGAKTIESFLRSPRMGTWLRELYFIEALEYENAGEMVRLLSHLLRNVPNLKKLAIRTWCRLDPADMYDFNDFAKEIANMQQLEALWLFPNRGHMASSPTIYEIIPHLKSLKSLHIRNWLGGGEEGQPLPAEIGQFLTNGSSGATLTTLSFVDGGVNEATTAFIPWLLRDSPLENLEVHTKDIYRLESGAHSPLFRGLQPFLSQIKTLRMHYSTFNEDKEIRTQFVMSCKNLKTLSLVIGTHHELNVFPESIEHLHVHYSTIWPMSGKKLHDCLQEQRASLKNLKTLKLTKDPIDGLTLIDLVGNNNDIVGVDGERVENAWHIDDLRTLCGEWNMELTNEQKFVTLDELLRM
ncbi:uncharacterized protein FOMMEDRAFT_29454 [Fomitiporia mediterranea MF3/22]|uniref:uncharacterized protein n=1 Tax=Fomitiporia mediterranea (strain MF3/22) TaxID=694068 RepID=UPI00044084BC|nr:uncharacterized protein FOMMEDRAFT_29454 [Fomitiporia mediterranea MF3/22]EJD02438.1 hypothetical protein FOMMEDRAFT_29454 [Fomitiporia mediterranea MF3/22]